MSCMSYTMMWMMWPDVFKIQLLHWLAHVVRMDGQASARRVFETDPSGGSCRRVRAPTRWRDHVKYDINFLGISNWRQIVAPWKVSKSVLGA